MLACFAAAGAPVPVHNEAVAATPLLPTSVGKPRKARTLGPSRPPFAVSGTIHCDDVNSLMPTALVAQA